MWQLLGVVETGFCLIPKAVVGQGCGGRVCIGLGIRVRVKTGKGHERQNQNPGKVLSTRSLSAIVPTKSITCALVQKQQSPVKSGLWRKIWVAPFNTVQHQKSYPVPNFLFSKNSYILRKTCYGIK